MKGIGKGQEERVSDFRFAEITNRAAVTAPKGDVTEAREGGGTFGCRSSQPFNHPLSRPVDRKGSGSAGCANGSLIDDDPTRKGRNHIMESLILAQNERWRRVLSMQVERQDW